MEPLTRITIDPGVMGETPAKDLLKEFWRLQKEAEKMLEGLGK
jgi:hypothetical protein